MSEESIIKLKEQYQIMFAHKPSNKSDLKKCFFRLKSSITRGSYKLVMFLPIITKDNSEPKDINEIYTGVQNNSLIHELVITKDHIKDCFDKNSISILEYDGNKWIGDSGNIIKYNYKDNPGDLPDYSYYLPLNINNDITENKSYDNFTITFGFNMTPTTNAAYIRIDQNTPGKKVIFLKGKQQTISNEYDPADIGKMLPIIRITKDNEILVCLKGKKYIYDHTTDPSNITIYGEWSTSKKDDKINIKTIEKKS